MTKKSSEGSDRDSPHVTIKEFCAHFRIRVRTYYRWKKPKKIKTHKLGTLVRIPRSEIERLEKESLD